MFTPSRLSIIFISVFIIHIYLVSNAWTYSISSKVKITAISKGKEPVTVPKIPDSSAYLINSRVLFNNFYRRNNWREQPIEVPPEQQHNVDNDDDSDDDDEDVFKPLPFPVNFQYYDRNRNGVIDIHELVDVTGMAKNVNEAFAASDANGDGEVEEGEYANIPWGYNAGVDAVLQD